MVLVYSRGKIFFGLLKKYNYLNEVKGKINAVNYIVYNFILFSYIC